MGTRGLTKVIDPNGKIVVAQYGQWDHYPSYQGVNILDFISQYGVLESLLHGIKRVYFLTEKQNDKLINKFNWEDKDSVDLFKATYPTLTRDLGSDVLKAVVYGSGRVPLRNEVDFENDELFCEGVYTINYQTRQFITKWNGNVTVYSLDNLPQKDVYLIDTERLTKAA